MRDQSLTPEVVQLLKVAGTTVYLKADMGERAALKSGGQWQVTRADLDGGVEAHEAGESK